jgi:UDP:flavonoid glycosyltransferase YjiC (YdhE family)
MTNEQFNDLVRSDIKRMTRYGRLFHWVFEYDPDAGFSADRINYGPIDVTASSWIVPGTIEEEEPEEEEPDREYEWEMDHFDRSYEKGDVE